MNLQSLLIVNELRTYLRDRADYRPEEGIGCCGRRRRVSTPVEGLPFARVPIEMLEDAEYSLSLTAVEWQRLRCRHDFEYWCARCATVRDKRSGRYVPFILNAPQRRVAAVLESDRRSGRPIRMILLKARQWGGSTLVQIYMAWIQLCLRRNWNSLICAQVKDTSSAIRRMYASLLSNYPRDLWDYEVPAGLKSVAGASNVKEISGSGGTITIASAQNQDAVRGSDYAMAHLSETAFWTKTAQRSPDDFMRAVCGAVALLPMTLIVIESTPNGVGNYFHREWLRNKAGTGDKHAVFVPWYEIELYRSVPSDAAALAASMSAYERRLWDEGLCLDQIWWYRCKLREQGSDDAMFAEFPTDDVEAFVNSGSAVFNAAAVDALRSGCRPPVAVGETDAAGTRFCVDPRGCLHVWEMPRADAVYVVAVDVGGRAHSSDYSVMAVMKRTAGGQPEVVGQWRGHIDHDLLASKAVALARFYRTALLVIESNTFETDNYGGSADSNMFILQRIANNYPRVYRRRHYDRTGRIWTDRIGFHTNRSTKAMLIDGLIEAVRDGSYVERCHGACDELVTYEQRQNGSYAAKDGYHDDMLMTRAIALHVIDTEPSLRPQPTSFARPESW